MITPFQVMATCGYSTYVGGSCGSSAVNPAVVQCVPLSSCGKDIKVHLKALDVRDATLQTEAQLLLARAGKQLIDASSKPKIIFV